VRHRLLREPGGFEGGAASCSRDTAALAAYAGRPPPMWIISSRSPPAATIRLESPALLLPLQSGMALREKLRQHGEVLTAVTICAPSAATLSHLKQISVRILEPRGVTPGVLEDLGWLELDSARLQRLERHPAIFHLDGVNGGTQLGPGGCAWPQNEVEVLPLDADGQESRSLGCREVTPLLEADDFV
jgi:hypothetical protein